MHRSIFFILFLNSVNFLGQDITSKKNDSVFEIESSVEDLILSEVSILGDKSNNQIELNFFLSHTLQDQEFQLHVGKNRPTAYDSTGREFKYDKIYFNFNKIYGTGGVIPMKIPVGIFKKVQITFDRIPSRLKSIELVKINYYLSSSDKNKDKVKGFFLIRNIPVLWK